LDEKGELASIVQRESVIIAKNYVKIIFSFIVRLAIDMFCHKKILKGFVDLVILCLVKFASIQDPKQLGSNNINFIIFTVWSNAQKFEMIRIYRFKLSIY